jgi:hypothetical protein
MRKYSPSLAIKEMPIKTTLTFYLTHVRRASFKKPSTTNAGHAAGEKNEPSYNAGGNIN